MAGNPDNSEVLLFIKLSLWVLRETYIFRDVKFWNGGAVV